jgi:hypothetical protein
MALADSFSTYYLLVGGNEPLERDTFESLAAPIFRDSFKAFDHSTVDVMTPNWQGTQDSDGNFLGFQVSSGVLSGNILAATPWEYVTGVVWNLYNKNVPPDLGSIRNRLHATLHQSLIDAGFARLQDALVPYGSLGASVGYYGWPAVPRVVLPTDAPAPAASKGGALAWGLLLSTALLAIAQGSPRR